MSEAKHRTSKIALSKCKDQKNKKPLRHYTSAIRNQTQHESSATTYELILAKYLQCRTVNVQPLDACFRRICFQARDSEAREIGCSGSQIHDSYKIIDRPRLMLKHDSLAATLSEDLPANDFMWCSTVAVLYHRVI